MEKIIYLYKNLYADITVKMLKDSQFNALFMLIILDMPAIYKKRIKT